MAKVILRQKAINDLSDIWKYTAFKWSENKADKYYQAIKFACEEIGINPHAGKKYFEISSELLGFKTGRHIIFYHILSENEIEVIRILHEQMDLKNRLKE
ncbi:type II toxin-antitoxin system RelE/ParE family toxin [Marinilabiliaceae bacterium JC017]|nr:type II toxin-antitoxin system RelE/ParE family toxin [Marinilabiliaceae bacterium JC017]